jgi:hypothetical protein
MLASLANFSILQLLIFIPNAPVGTHITLGSYLPRLIEGGK